MPAHGAGPEFQPFEAPASCVAMAQAMPVQPAPQSMQSPVQAQSVQSPVQAQSVQSPVQARVQPQGVPKATEASEAQVAELRETLANLIKTQAAEMSEMKATANGLRSLLLSYCIPEQELDEAANKVPDTQSVSTDCTVDVRSSNKGTPPPSVRNDSSQVMTMIDSCSLTSFQSDIPTPDGTLDVVDAELLCLEKMTGMVADRSVRTRLARLSTCTALMAIHRTQERIESQGGICRNLSALLQASCRHESQQVYIRRGTWNSSC